jgi:hypothetical protein
MSRTLLLVGVLGVLAFAAGCQQPNLEEMMQVPPRPVELDRLAMFEGSWEGTGEMRMGDQVLQSRGRSTYAWDADKRVMTERGEFSCGKNNTTMQSLGVWHWDDGDKKFRTYWADTMGWGNGTARYDAEARVWHLQGNSHYGGHTGNFRGTGRMIDDRTMEWTMKETDALGLMTFMEMKGTMKKR